MLVITSFKYMLIDQLKKQMSDGNSTCPLDPMDKQNSNGHNSTCPLDPMDQNSNWIHWIHWTLDTLEWLSQWPSIYIMSVCLSLRHSNKY